VYLARGGNPQSKKWQVIDTAAQQIIQQARRTRQTGQTQLERRLFTLEEYERIIEAGVFQEDECLELIRGEIVTMPPSGFAHGFGVEHVNRLFSSLVRGKALVWVQSPIQVAPNSRLEPDVALLRPRPDLSPKSPPTASDVILVVEVAETSIKYDRGVKGRLYAQASIPEYWLVNLRDGVIEVYTEPSGGSYKQAGKAHQGEKLTLPAELGGGVEVSDILGKTGEK
jgi:Uma2 family endonuclease